MTISEFSDGFTTLLNSYNTQAMFGEQASKAEITLDEYEKSVFLTQAQDIIVKQYFDLITDLTREGFDGGEIRQMDFSSLITTVTTNKFEGESTDSVTKLVGRGDSARHITYKVIDSNLAKNTGLNVQIVDQHYITPGQNYEVNIDTSVPQISIKVKDTLVAEFTTMKQYLQYILGLKTEYFEQDSPTVADYISLMVEEDAETTAITPVNIVIDSSEFLRKADSLSDYGITFELPEDILVILNERLIVDGKKYVVVPLNYREYDRMDSRPYSQPLKKQAWRLFNNIQGFDTFSEIIPIWDSVNLSSDVIYKVRYVRRPRPIILVNLPDGLEIDGKTTATECELNKILHMDILNKAFELALSTRGGGGQQRRRRSNDDEDEQ